MAVDGHGTTVTFGTSGFSMALIDVGGPGLSRAAIDSSVMSTSTAMTYIPAALSDSGEMSLTVEHDADAAVPINGAVESIVIDWAGLSDTWTFDGFMVGYEPTASIGERMTASVTVKVTGTVTIA